MRRMAASLVAVLAALLFAKLAHLTGTAHSRWYLELASLLLAVGLFASTHGISLPEAREHLRLVVLAVTLGVLAKAALISLVMVLVFRRPEYLVLGVAVAQIDPLSVAAQRRRARMSPQAQTVLSAWASFDDPVTMLLTIYLSAVALGLTGRGSGAGGGAGAAGGDLFAFGLNTAGNVAFAAGGYLVWRLLCRPGWGTGRLRAGAQLAVLVGLVLLGAHLSLLLGVAVMGLFYRPAALVSLERVTQAAYYVAAAALGLVLVHGFSPGRGAVLGVAAFGAQFVVGLVVARGRLGPDRWYLALAQQNGITAIILALLLEARFAGTVGIIAPAIVVINLMNAAGNAAYEQGVPVLARRVLAWTVAVPRLAGAGLLTFGGWCARSLVPLPADLAARPVPVPARTAALAARPVPAPARTPAPTPAPAHRTGGG